MILLKKNLCHREINQPLGYQQTKPILIQMRDQFWETLTWISHKEWWLTTSMRTKLSGRILAIKDHQVVNSMVTTLPLRNQIPMFPMLKDKKCRFNSNNQVR
jgi:hypothetical protein